MPKVNPYTPKRKMFSNETLEPYVEAAKVRLLTDFTHETIVCGKIFLKKAKDCCRGLPYQGKFPEDCLQCKRFVP